MRIALLTAAFVLTCTCANSQNLIGFNGKEIQNYMKENRGDMNFNNVVNSKFSYLKYSDTQESQTILFFLNPDSVCRSVRIICDASLKSHKIKELNSVYVRNSENKWTDKRDGKEFVVKMVDGEWSCVISIEPAK